MGYDLPPSDRFLISRLHTPLAKFTREMQAAAFRRRLLKARPAPALSAIVRTVRPARRSSIGVLPQESTFCLAPVGWTLWTYRFFEVSPSRLLIRTSHLSTGGIRTTRWPDQPRQYAEYRRLYPTSATERRRCGQRHPRLAHRQPVTHRRRSA